MKKSFIYLFIFLLFIDFESHGLQRYSNVQDINDNSLIIRGKIESNINADSVFIGIWDKFISVRQMLRTPHRSFSASIEKGYFSFIIDSVAQLSYLSIGIGKYHGLPLYSEQRLYIVNPGDSIEVQVLKSDYVDHRIVISDSGDSICLNCFSYFYSGKGSAKFNCKEEMEKIQQTSEKKWHNRFSKTGFQDNNLLQYIQNYFKEKDHSLDLGISVLERYRSELDPVVYKIIRADLVGENKASKYHFLYLKYATQRDSAIKQQLADFYKQNIDTDTLKMGSTDSILALSALYPVFILEKLLLNHILLKKKNTYDNIEACYSGILKDRLLVNHVLDNYEGVNNPDRIFKSAISSVKTPYYLSVIKQFFDHKKAQKSVSSFSLPDSSGRMIEFSKFRGKVVFIDFWYTGCAGCANYYKNIVSKVKDIFKGNPNVVFISISIDTKKQQWVKGLTSGFYTSSNAINLYTGGLGANHPIVKQFNVYSYPRPIIIGKSGSIFNDNSYLLRKGVDNLVNLINTAIAE